MEIIKGYKFRLEPNRKQREFIDRTNGCGRFIYNHFLGVRSKAWEESQTSISYNKTSQMLTELKTELPWLKEVDSMALQESLRDLDKAFQNFFSKRGGYPKFHSKHNHNQSYRTRNQSNGIRIMGKYLVLPKLGPVKFRQSRQVVGKITNATIRRTPSGKYFVSLCVTAEADPPPKKGGQLGIDVGIKSFYTDSNGNSIDNPKHLRKSEKKIVREQRKLSRKEKGSKNQNKQRIRLARVHEKIANQRKDFLQKQTTMLVRENQTICVENLRIKNMIRNRKLAKSISDISWGIFFRMLEYKAPWHGTEVIKVPTFYPSSQTCHQCGYQNPEVKSLKVREWVCPKCGAFHDRDENASINILTKGLQMA